MKVLLYISLLASSLVLARGGDRAGNGGDAIVCYNQKITEENYKELTPISTEVKDYWEYSQMMNGIELDLGPGESFTEKVMFVLNRLKGIDKMRAEKLITRFQDPYFYSLVERAKLPEVDDSHSILVVNDNCIELQIAFQIYQEKMFQSKVLIDESIFSAMDEDNKAGLLLHELFYEQDIQFANSETSDKIRYITYFFSADFIGLFSDLKDGYSEKFGHFVEVNEIDYFVYRKNFETQDVYKNRAIEKKDLSSFLLPSQFEIIDSKFAFDQEVAVSGEMLIKAQKETIQGRFGELSIPKDGEYSFEFDSRGELLEGELHLSSEIGELKILKTYKDQLADTVTFDLKPINIELQDAMLEGVSQVAFKDNEIIVRAFKAIHVGDVHSLTSVGEARVSIQNKELVSVEGQFYFGEQEVRFYNGFDKIVLSRPMEFETSLGKIFVQVLDLKQNLTAQSYIGKSKRKDVLLGVGTEMDFNLGNCAEDKCRVELQFDASLDLISAKKLEK